MSVRRADITSPVVRTLIGALNAELLRQYPQPGATHFRETGHNLGGRFRQFWQQNGGLAIFGYPISEEFTETLEDGNPYLVQYFERVRLEYHPENPAPYDVLLGQFGYLILQGGR